MLLSHLLHSPIIVMGMAQCGTTLLAEMVHKGGTPMFAGNPDPSYDTGLKYERPLCQRINRQILGVPRDGKNPHSTVPMWTWDLQPFPQDEINALRDEVGESAWGFKDPRTTLTYGIWQQAFPGGARLYSYRGHREYLRRSLRVQTRFQLGRARQHLRAWLAFNEAVLQNCAADASANRPFALVYYDELMESDTLLAKIEDATRVPLFDARAPDLRRTQPTGSPSLSLREKLFVHTAEAGYQARLQRVYQGLETLRLRAA